MKNHDYIKHANEYKSLGINGTFYLAFRDIPHLLKQNPLNDSKTLDYGCGTGRSTRFLHHLGLDVIGIDINLDMLNAARSLDPQGSYCLIESAILPFNNSSFDFIFSSFVFEELSDLESIRTILKEWYRVLKPSGQAMIVATSEQGYKGNWVSFSYNFSENREIYKSGETVKVLIRGTNIILYDYYWTDQNYKEVFSDTHFDLIELHNPIGFDDEFSWEDERIISPVNMYILKKNSRTQDY